MKYYFLIVVLFWMAQPSMNAQDGDLNMTLVAHVPAPEGGSGVWHYFDKKKKTEYAVFGSRNAVVLYSLEDPAKPKERFRFTGITSTWREVFSYGEFVYAVTDVQGADGLVVIDMRKAPDTITGKFWKPSITAGGQTANLGTCHTLFIDEKGILSLNGCTPWRGTLFFDLKPDPMNPKYIGEELKRYVHDNFVRGDTLYTSEIYDGYLSIYDVKDYKNPKELVNIKTPHAFTHNAWISDDAKYVFTTDERSDAYVAAYDISDYSKPKLLDVYRPKDTEGTGVIPHNTRYINGYLVTAFYTDGVKIVDAHKPDNLVEVGSYDTYIINNNTGFYGTWGVSPYLPSGLIVASNIEDGLFILRPNYVRACYLEGLVTDTITGLPINGVSIKITAPRKNEENSDVAGQYKTGYATAGTYDVVYTHPDYFPKTVKVNLVSGQVTLKDVQLISRRPSITAKVIVKDNITKQIIRDARIRMFNVNGDKMATTGIDGSASFFVFKDSIPYDLVVGKWGFFHKGLKFESEKQSPTIEVFLDRGYQDDFIFDQGWTVTSTATTGIWVRDVPLGTVYRNEQFQTDKDIANDFGKECYVTGNVGTEPTVDDVDNGTTTLTSPVMKLSHYKRPLLSFYYWFANGGGQGGAPNDKINFRLSNGITTVFLKEVDMHSPKWSYSDTINLLDNIQLSDSMRFIVDITDQDPGHLLEGALDAFLVKDAIITKTDNLTESNIELLAFPTAFNQSTLIKYKINGNADGRLEVVNTFGASIQSINIQNKEGLINLGSEYQPGVYFVVLKDSNQRSKTIRIIKQ